MSGNGQQPQSSLLAELEGPINDQQGLQILVDAVSLANLRGAFNIMEAGNVSTAVRHFTRKRPEGVPTGMIPTPDNAPYSQTEMQQLINPIR